MERSTSSRAMSAPWKTKTAKFGTLELKRPEDQSPKASSSSHLSPKTPKILQVEASRRQPGNCSWPHAISRSRTPSP